MAEVRIEYKDYPRAPWTLWCLMEGTRTEIERSARGLLEEIKEEYARGQVSIVDNRGKRRRVRLNGKATPGTATETPKDGGDEGGPAASPFTESFESPLA